MPQFEIGYTQLQTGFLGFFWPLYCHTVCSVLCSPIPHWHAGLVAHANQSNSGFWL